jgi:predicted AAA+ superfamily ATPase
MYGYIFKNFVASELLKSIKPQKIKLYHYRDSNNVEVDFLLENDKGELVAIEVKTTTRISKNDTKNIKLISNHLPIKASYILHPGKDLYPVDDKCLALPVSFLYGK